MIRELFQEIFENYQSVRDELKRGEPGMPLEENLVGQIPKAIKANANLPARYGIKGSMGEYNLYIPEVPWIEIYDSEITDASAKRGYYIVYLFRADMSGVYLSLNQGYTQYKTTYGKRKGDKRIKENTRMAKQLLDSSFRFSKDPIDLRGKNATAKGYELGDICHIFYSKDVFPNDEKLLQDLSEMTAPYEELRGIIGDNILSIPDHAYKIDVENDELQYQNEVQKEIEEEELPDGPIEKPRQSDSGNSNSSGAYKRKPKRARKALKRANYQCENDRSHSTFKARGKNHQYVEAHHLIPMQYQDQFEHSLDVPENIISLCPNCHRKIHHATSNVRENLIGKLYDSRLQGLEKREIELSLMELKQLY